MEINIHHFFHHHHADKLELAIERVIMNQAELAQSLADIKAQADKSKNEIIDKVTTLEEKIVAAGNTSPEVDAALADLKTSVQGLDDLNPDAPAPAPAPEPAPEDGNTPA